MTTFTRIVRRSSVLLAAACFVTVLPGTSFAGVIDLCADEACLPYQAIPGVDPDAIVVVGIGKIAGSIEISVPDETLPPVFVQSAVFGGAQITDPVTGTLMADPIAGDVAMAAAANNDTSYACVNNGTNRYFHAGSPVTWSGKNNKWQYRWQWHPYVQYYARTVGNRWTYQPELCVTGGIDGQNGWRTLYNASVMAAKTNDGSRRIGLSADSGASGDRSSASLTIGAAFGPVTISANVPTNPQGSLAGFYGSPRYSSEADAFHSTESVGQWTAGCTFSRTCGSSKMQTQVHHGLFEYYHGTKASSYAVDAQWNYYCSGPYGQGCG